MQIEQIDLTSEREVQRFMDFPYQLYAGHPLWVPPIRTDTRAQLNPEKHPFYEHSEAEFFLLWRQGELLGRIALLENKPYNRYHELKQAQFYLFECVEDFEAAEALFRHAFDWAQDRGLNQIVGPKGFSVFDGYGMLVEGFEFRPIMTMMNYNPVYYPRFMERLGFEKEVDFVSCYIQPEKFRLDERIHRIAARAADRSGLEVIRFDNKREFEKWVDRIGETYNRTFVDNWEYYPLTDREIEFVKDNLMTVADPRLIKIIVDGEDVIGFLFAFHDLSSAIQRSGGRLFPFGVPDLLMEMRRTEWISLNGAGILPEYQGLGGNALLYSEMEKTLNSEFTQFRYADLTQVAESAEQMRKDLVNLGGVPYKNHRVYVRRI